MKRKRNGAISLSEIYILRVFHWEEDKYISHLFFTFGEAWKEFSYTVEDMEAVFTGGMITPEGHYYLAQTEQYCIQLCPFISEFYEDTETEDV